MKTVADNKCPSCGASISFNPTTQKWDCAYCGSSFGIEEFEKMQGKEEITQSNVEIDEYTCPDCGAALITDANTVATHCVYCGNTTIMKNRLQEEFKPDKIIPFKKQKDEAIKAYQLNVKKKWFAPSDFHKKENIEKISGVYIPFWLYDCYTNGTINANAEKIRYWSDSNYNYKETEIYNCVRSGELEITDLPVDGSTKFEDDIMDSIEPYNYSEFKEFNRAYLSGFLAEKYDLSSNDVYKRAEERVKNTLENELKESIKGYSSVTVRNSNINVQKGDVEYALLPVWMMNIKYKDKKYTFAMNGQTGKVVGNVPIDYGKMIWKSALCFGIAFVVCFIIGFMGGY